MRMAKASEADLQMAIDLARMLESFEHGYFPSDEDAEESETFNCHDKYECERAMELILDKMREGSLFRVVFGMLVLLDPKNELVDPALSYLEHHPDAKWAREQRGDLIEVLGEALPMVEDDVFKYEGLDAIATDETVVRIRRVLAREAAYGLIRYLAGGAFA